MPISGPTVLDVSELVEVAVPNLGSGEDTVFTKLGDNGGTVADGPMRMLLP